MYLSTNPSAITCIAYQLNIKSFPVSDLHLLERILPSKTPSSLTAFHKQDRSKEMANGSMKPAASLLLALNFCMYVVLLGIGGWAMNRAIDHGFVIDPGFQLPAHFSPIYFPMGNAATGFFVMFALLAGVFGAASCISGFYHLQLSQAPESSPAAVTFAILAWSLTVLAMGFACKEIELEFRNARLVTMEAFSIILSATQLVYVAALYNP